MGNIAEGFNQGLAQGAGLAQHIENVRNQRQKAQEDMEKHQLAVSDHFTQRLKDLLFIPEKYQKPMKLQIQSDMEKLGYAVDPSFFDAVTDKDNRAAAIASINHVMGLPDDQRSQAGVQLASMAMGGIAPAMKFFEGVKEAQAKISMAQVSTKLKADAGARADESLHTRQAVRGDMTLNNDSVIKANIQRLDGVARINDLLDGASKGEIVTNGQIKNLIGEEVLKLETGANAAGLGMSERNTMTNTAKSWESYVTERFTGNPANAITPGQLKQAVGQFGIMAKSYMEQTDSRFAYLATSSVPGVAAAAKDKANTFRQQYATRFAQGWNGMVRVPKPGVDNQGDAVASLKQKILGNPALADKFKKAGLDPESPDFAVKYAEYQNRKNAPSASAEAPAQGQAPAPTPEPETSDNNPPQESSPDMSVTPEPDANALDVSPEPSGDNGGGQ